MSSENRAAHALGRTYPRPIVDHATARTRALDAYAAVKAA
jgi:deoxyribodipyrimidine photo-lyase